jgi:hypothetical protein
MLSIKGLVSVLIVLNVIYLIGLFKNYCDFGSYEFNPNNWKDTFSFIGLFALFIDCLLVIGSLCYLTYLVL